MRCWQFPLARPLLACLSGLLLALTAHAQTLTVGGTGSSEPLIRKLFEDFRRQNPDVSLKIIQPPLGTGGSIKALALGRIDLAVLGRQPTLEEKTRMGRVFPLATTPLVFASYEGPRQPGFRLDQLAAVYAGQIKVWDTGRPIRLIHRARYESDTLALKSMSPAMNQAVTDALAQPGITLADNDLDTVELLTRTPGSLGPTTLGLLSTLGLSRLQIHSIEGETPSIATLKNGRYPWRKTLVVALPEKTAPVTERFVAYLQSGPAIVVLQRYDYLPVMP